MPRLFHPRRMMLGLFLIVCGFWLWWQDSFLKGFSSVILELPDIGCLTGSPWHSERLG